MVPPHGLAVVTVPGPNQPLASRLPFTTRAAPWLWGLAALDLVAIAWMIAAGTWLDNASWYTRAVTLGGRHLLVLVLTSIAFVMLAGLAIATHGFASATRSQTAFISLACVISVVALAGALSAILLLLIAALVIGFVARPIMRR